MRLSWRGCLPWIPTFVLLPEKVQRVTAVSEAQCLYEVFETQTGMLAYVIMWTLGEKQSVMAREQAESLKRFVEAGLGQ